MNKKIELLAPAKNLECGLEAINAGADAVYIGAPNFGARSAAGNTIEDIQKLVDYAHLFRVRIYVTMNTILYDDELEEAQKMVKELYAVGVDALIVQDMAYTQMDIPPIPLHASTQMDNRSVEKIAQLSRNGFSQVVLARELSLEETRKIHQAIPEMPLETFVHGALCVSYSGQCYASEHCFNRSANRGACAQFCRLSFDLIDDKGEVIVEDRHLLSLKDMNRSNSIKDLIEAGITSFKIEGRLKDVTYVKNITAYYRNKIDEVLSKMNGYERSSVGTSFTSFKANPEKSFNRRFTNYFLYGRRNDIFCFETPKAIGEFVGTLKNITPYYITIAGSASFNNGDGLCFFDENGKLHGFRVNRSDGNKLYLNSMPEIKKGTSIYRNLDVAFNKELLKNNVDRKLTISILLQETEEGFNLSANTENGIEVKLKKVLAKEEAAKPQEENVKRQLNKLGGTPFNAKDIKVDWEKEFFIPSSFLSKWRQELVEELLQKLKATHPAEKRKKETEEVCLNKEKLSYAANISNKLAENFYRKAGVKEIEPAFELSHPSASTVMTCKHCIRYALGYCPTHHKKPLPWTEPLKLRLPNGELFPLKFDCKNCQMIVTTE